MGLNTFSRARKLWGLRSNTEVDMLDKTPEAFPLNHQLPQADGFVHWLLITEPSSLFFQDRLPVQLKNQELLLPGTWLQRPRAKQAQICVLPVQRDISWVSTSITNMLGRKHDLGCPSCQHKECHTRAAKTLSYMKNKYTNVMGFFSVVFFFPLTILPKIKHQGLGSLRSMGLFVVSNFIKTPGSESTSYLTF